ncbi:MAG: hypothetical protein JWN62_3872 [Acidimicrobiales bacterium]|nr:hypothetical protein [Acidimicrobiales bacterium]
MEAVSQEMVAWKGSLTLDEVSDPTVLHAGKMGDHFELKLLDCRDTPLIDAIVRHIDGITIQIVGREALPDCDQTELT